MKGKLIKRDNDFYSLIVDGLVMATSNGMIVDYKLSIKNCEAIANGYDLDELAREACNITDPLRLDSQKYKQDPYFKIGFNKGFQKALEILGDKKFSVLDIQNVIDSNEDSLVYQTISENGDISFCLDEDVLIQSLQQTEWDVEIVGSGTVYKTVLDCCTNHHPKFGCTKKNGCSCISNELPQLDKDGCLILKRSI